MIGGLQLRKKTVIVVAISLLIVVLAVFLSRELRIIGEVTGAEWNRLTIGQTEYLLINDLDYTTADKGRYLGKAKYNESTVRLYSVNGDEEGKYIYAVWDWEGFFFVREE